MAALSFTDLRARALAVIEALEKESPGIGVFVVLVAKTDEGKAARFAAESTYDQVGGAEVLRIVSAAWGQS